MIITPGLLEQKARLGAMESIRKPRSRAVVVATDVAARGLDIPSVATVVHYDTARAVDTFIHRAGRTAVSYHFEMKFLDALLFIIFLIIHSCFHFSVFHPPAWCWCKSGRDQYLSCSTS